MRYFELRRDEDFTGVSGEGHVASGAVTDGGFAVMLWHNADNPRLDTDQDGLSIKPGPDGAEMTEVIHGHGGRTRLVWVDEEPVEGLAGRLEEELEEVLGEVRRS